MIYEYEEIGKELKKLRKEKGRTVEELVEEIKISEEYIKAIEAGDLTELPSQIYYGLFVRSYCKELGLDADKFLSKYSIEETPTNGEDDEKTSEPSSAPQATVSDAKSDSSPLVIALWVIGILIVIVAAIYWFSKPDESADEKSSATTESVNIRTSEPVAVDISKIDSAVIVEPEPVKPDPLRLNISVTDRSWVYVMADGDTVLNRNLNSGASRNLTADEAFVFSIGNPQGVSMILNGRPMRAISNSGRPILNEEINQSNFEGYFLTVGAKPDTGDIIVDGN